MKLSSLKANIDRIRKSHLAKNTLWMLLAQGGRLILQGVYFVIIARSLGADQYGAFVGATSLVSTLAPFAALGTGNLMIKNVARNRSLFSEYWGNALFVTGISSLLLTGVLLLIAPFVLPPTIKPLLLVLAAIADLCFLRVLDASGQAFAAVLWMGKTAWLNILPIITRVIAALILVRCFPHPTVMDWMWLYLGSTGISALIGIFMVNRDLGLPKPMISRIKPEFLEGCYFSIGLSAQTVYNDIDKTMLARLASLEVTGIYATAYRVIDIAFSPVRSLLASTYASFFKQGVSGISGCIKLATKLVPFAGIYSLIASLILIILSPILPLVLGQEYADSAGALRWLAPLLVFKSLHYFAADTLSGSGFQGIRSAVQVSVAGFNIAMNLWLIPRYSWQGAAWTSLASDGLLMLGLWAIVIFLQFQSSESNRSKATPQVK